MERHIFLNLIIASYEGTYVLLTCKKTSGVMHSEPCTLHFPPLVQFGHWIIFYFIFQA